MTDRDPQMPGAGHSSYGEAVGVVLQNGIAAMPRLVWLRRQCRLSGQALSLESGYSDATIC